MMLSGQCIAPSFLLVMTPSSLELHTHRLLEMTHVQSLPPDSDLKLLDMFPWLGWKGMSICLSVVTFPLSTQCLVLLRPNMAGQQEEGEKEGSQEKRMEEHSKSAFSDCFGPSLGCFLRDEFPFCRIFLGFAASLLASAQMVSADLREDAARIAVNLVSSCTLGQLLGEEIMQTTCGIHLGGLWGCLWHSTGSTA